MRLGSLGGMAPGGPMNSPGTSLACTTCHPSGTSMVYGKGAPACGPTTIRRYGFSAGGAAAFKARLPKRARTARRTGRVRDRTVGTLRFVLMVLPSSDPLDTEHRPGEAH